MSITAGLAVIGITTKYICQVDLAQCLSTPLRCGHFCFTAYVLLFFLLPPLPRAQTSICDVRECAAR